MSRIEKALEKAVQLRRTTASSVSTCGSEGKDSAAPFAAFDIGEPVIDTAAVHKHVVCITDPCSLAAEEYRKLRARIFQATEKDFLNSVLVTSSLDGEGKTVTAMNLAVTIAQEIDHTVLLIDADLRKPAVHSYLGMKPQYGLSDYLQGKAQLSDIFIKTGIGKLALLPAGTPPANPAELLASDKMRDLVRELKYRYRDRYIIFDSPPLLTTADGLYLKEYIDGIIFVVQAARTSSKAAARALSLLKGVHIFGTVFNNVPDFISQHAMYYYEDSKSPGGVAGLSSAAGLMDRATNLINSTGSLFHFDRIHGAGQKIKAGISGLTKWTKKG